MAKAIKAGGLTTKQKWAVITLMASGPMTAQELGELNPVEDVWEPAPTGTYNVRRSNHRLGVSAAGSSLRRLEARGIAETVGVGPRGSKTWRVTASARHILAEIVVIWRSDLGLDEVAS